MSRQKLCKHCGGIHPSTYHTEKYIKDEGFPTHDKKYASSHEAADKAEKKKYPKGYEKLKKLVRKTPKGELLGKNTKSGKVDVSKRVPTKLRGEVAFHEKVESKNLRKKK